MRFLLLRRHIRFAHVRPPVSNRISLSSSGVSAATVVVINLHKGFTSLSIFGNDIFRNIVRSPHIQDTPRNGIPLLGCTEFLEMADMGLRLN